MGLSSSQIAEFKENGHLTVEDVLTADEVQALAARADEHTALKEQLAKVGPGRLPPSMSLEDA